MASPGPSWHHPSRPLYAVNGAATIRNAALCLYLDLGCRAVIFG